MRKPLYWCVALFVTLIFSGCDRGEEGRVNALHNDTPLRTTSLVEATKPVRRDISAYLEETGHITAENQVEVLAKGTGHCVNVLVEEGDRVGEGDILAELDKAEMEAQVRQSRVNVQQQKTTYDRAEWGLREGITPRADRDNAKSAYEQAQATLEMQEVQLSFLTIRAPISGIVTKRLVQEGMLVSSGMPVFNIVDPTSYILPIQVTERSLPRLRIGQEARVTIDSSGDREFVAEVRRINPGIDPQTGTVKVILDFQPEDYQYLRESAFARYRLVMETHEDTLAVPKDAVLEENARRYVMIVEEAQAEPAAAAQSETDDATGDTGNASAAPEAHTGWVADRVAVQTGLEDSQYTEIVSGISDDTRVITLGQQTVNEGDAVEVGNLEDTLESLDSLTADELLDKARDEKRQQDAADEAAQGDAPDA